MKELVVNRAFPLPGINTWRVFLPAELRGDEQIISEAVELVMVQVFPDTVTFTESLVNEANPEPDIVILSPPHTYKNP